MALTDALIKKFEFQLEKKKLINIRARVGFAEDVSPSMNGLYASGVMEKLNERILPVALKFDDNGKMDVAAFDTEVFELPEMGIENYQGYVSTHLASGNRSRNGGTAYGPPIRHFREFWFTPAKTGGFLSRMFGGGSDTSRDKEKQEPAFLILQTDGANQDVAAAEQAVIECAAVNMYITFLTVGREDFSFVEYLAEKYPNVGFFNVPDINSISDEALYDGLITDELASWLKNAAA